MGAEGFNGAHGPIQWAWLLWMLLLWSAVMITLQTQFSEDRSTRAPLWYGPIKRPAFSSREVRIVFHLGPVSQRQSGASLVPLPMGSHVVASERKSSPFYSSLWPLALSRPDPTSSQGRCSSLKVNKLQRSTYPVCIAAEFNVERKDFGANVAKIQPWAINPIKHCTGHGMLESPLVQFIGSFRE